MNAVVTELFDPSSAELISDPYPTYARLRDAGPILRHPAGFWCVPRHAECAALLRDRRFGHDEADSGPGADVRSPSTTLNDLLPPVDGVAPVPFMLTNPPEHRRIRALVEKGFGPRAIERFRPVIDERVRTLVDAAVAAADVEVMDALANGLPTWTMCHWFGIATSEWQRIRRLVEDFSVGFDPAFTLTDDQIERCRNAALGLREYILGIIDERSGSAGDDLISVLVDALRAGHLRGEGELIATVAQLLVAGNETSVGLIGNSLYHLAQRPALLRLLAERPELVEPAVEELLRFDSPIQLVERTALDEATIAGTRVAAGERVFVLLASANRDERVHPSPDELDITRSPMRHVSFGGGIHFCIGAQLARVLGRAVIGQLAATGRTMELVGEPERRPRFWLRSPSALTVRFSPGTP